MPTGRDLVALQLQQRGKPYVWGATGPKAFDCSGLNYYTMGLLKIQGAHAHRTAHALYLWCKQSGTLRSVSDARGIIGAWGFAIDRHGHAHHVATSLGNGSTIEAANPRDGVNVFRWDGRFQAAGLCPSLDFGPNPAPPVQLHPPTLQDVINLSRIHSQLRPFQVGDGARNDLAPSVKLIQFALAHSGIQWRQSIPVTGEYDDWTRDCVAWYQRARGLAVHPMAIGAVDRITFDAMYPPK